MKEKELRVIKTESNDFTLYRKDIDEHYHSTKGAIAESMHVYINNGIAKIEKNKISIFEIGFGTGLNAFLSAIYSIENNLKVNYFGIEKYPVEQNLNVKLNYSKDFPEYKYLWNKILKSKWNIENTLVKNFKLTKLETDFILFEPKKQFDLIYYDAFAPDKQPEMWTNERIKKVTQILAPRGLITTYTAKGIVKQKFREQNLEVKRLKGALGKHHMLNIWKK